MRDQQTLALGGDVHCLALYNDATEGEVHIVGGPLGMVAVNLDAAGPLSGLSQYRLQDVAGRLMPVPSTFELPPYDDVADEIEIVPLVVAQEIKERRRLAPPGAEMGIRDPDGA